MPTATAQGKKFNFPEGVTPEQMGLAIDEFFSQQQPITPAVEAPTGRVSRRASGQRLREQKVKELEAQKNIEALQAGQITSQDLTPEQIDLIQQQKVAAIPEISKTGIAGLVGEGQGFGTALALMTAFDPNEMGKILQAQFPEKIAIQSTPEGEVIATNRETGGQVSLNKPGISGIDVIQGLGIISAFTPAALVTKAAPGLASQLIGRQVASKLGVRAVAGAGTSAATEAGLQGIQEASGGEFNKEDVAIATALGGAAELVLPAGKALLEKARSLRNAGAATPEEAVRMALFESRGFRPTRPQITQAPGEFQLQQEIQKGGGPVREVLDIQEQRFAEAFEQQARETGGEVATSGSTPIDEIVDRSTGLDQKISELYKATTEAAPNAKNIKISGLNSVLKQNIGKDRISKGLVSAITSDLKSFGVVDSKGKVVGKISVKTAEEIRKGINSFHDSTSDTGRMLMREMKEALDKDVFSVAGQDVFDQARSAKRSFEQGLNRAKISKFDSRKSNLVRDMLENKINPNTFIKDVIFSKKWREEDIRQLKSYLNQTPSGQQSLKDIRAQTIDTIQDAIFTEKGELKGTQLAKEIGKIGKPKLKVIFDKQELKFLDDMKEIVKLRTPARAEALGLGPSGAAIKEIKTKFPIFGRFFDAFDNFKKSRLVLRLPKKRVPQEPLPEIEAPLQAVQLTRQEAQ